jgi:hypothetical protein
MLRAVFSNDAGFACSGTVVTPTFVLTAAHCLDEAGGPPGTTLVAGWVHNLPKAFLAFIAKGGKARKRRRTTRGCTRFGSAVSTSDYAAVEKPTAAVRGKVMVNTEPRF